uniref:Exocyst complex component 3 n=1 Tax=Strigamia maritima TaxID=126957 RepID=T1JCR4_STRMM
MASHKDVEELELQAKAKAAKHVANLLQRSHQLERVEQYKRSSLREKASVEALLKTTVQSQLDGVKNGLNLLQTALIDVKDIKMNLTEIDEGLKTVSKLREQLEDVREEHLNYFQNAVAMEHLKNIFTVPESVKKTHVWINEGKYLQAHYCLAELENSRNDLLFQMYKLPDQNKSDQIKLKVYFSGVDELYQSLSEHLWSILKKVLPTVRSDPKLIVTAMRIIEREEKSDQLSLELQKQTGFLPPGRTREWRKKAFVIMEQTIQDRLEKNQYEVRDENTMWLVRHLEITRLLILEDLRVVKSLCVQCFPPSYDIVNKYVKMYHNCLSKHLLDIIACGLENDEYISILMWLKTYESPELLKHPEINVSIKEVGPLLDDRTVGSLKSKYINKMEQNFSQWMKTTIESEKQDWFRDNIEPESDAEGCYQTTLPIVVFQMVEQNLLVAKTIGFDLVVKIFRMSMTEMTNLGSMYLDAIMEYKNTCMQNRNTMKYFTHYMVAAVNNCLHFIELCHQLKDQIWKPGMHDDEAVHQFDSLIKTYKRLREQTCNFLLDEMFMDLKPHFQDLMTRKWLSSDAPMDTICLTVEDFHQEYQHLRPKNHDDVIVEIKKRICKNYIAAMLQKRITFSNFDERKDCAEKVIREVEQLQNLIKNLAPHLAKADSLTDVLVRFAEVLRVKDKEILPLILSGLIHNYPDMTQEHLSALLSNREDIGWFDIKNQFYQIYTCKLVSEIIPDAKTTQAGQIPKSILSQIELPTALFGNNKLFSINKSAHSCENLMGPNANFQNCIF